MRDILSRGVRYFRRHGLVSTLRRALRETHLADVSADSASAEPPIRCLPASDDETYRRWIEAHEPSVEDLHLQRAAAQRLGYRPLISIVTPVFNPDIRVFRDMLESVLAQTYDNWELCLADASTDSRVSAAIEEYRGRHERIVARHLSENRGIALNSNEALSLARGEFIALLDHDDMLAPFALFEVARALDVNPGIDVLFSDRDVMTFEGKRLYPFFKPGWSPDYLLAQNYLCHLIVIRKSVVDKVGGFSSGYDGSQDYDLFLRVTESTDRVIHVPHVLYHWRIVPGSSSVDPTAKVYAYDAALRVLRDAAERRGWSVSVDRGSSPGCYDVTFNVSGTPVVSVIVASRRGGESLSRCVSSLGRTTYEGTEVAVVRPRGTPDGRETAGLSAAPESAPLHILDAAVLPARSALFNYGAAKSGGAYLVFLDEDAEVITPEWLQRLLGLVQRPGTGAAGPRLITPSGTIHSAGLILSPSGAVLRSHHGFPRDHHGYNSMIKNLRNVSAVDCCLMIRRSVFEALGGFDEHFDCYGMIDLCMRLRDRDLVITYQPQAEILFRGDDSSLRSEPADNERTRFAERWAAVLAKGDPYYSPHLSMTREDFSLHI